MAALKSHVKLFIVQRLAWFDTPTEVAEAVKEEFRIVIDRAHIAQYDPTNHSGRELGAKLKQQFYEFREKFIDDLYSIPTANRAVRVRELEKLYRRATKAGNLAMAKDLLEQIAKEEGGFFTNKLKISDLGGRGLLQGFYEQIKAKPLPIAYEVIGQVVQHAPQNTEVKEVVVEEAPKPKKSLAFAGRD